MGDFVKRLETKWEREDCGHFRQFRALTVGKWTVSVQASEHHYCSPRQTLPPDHYYEWECAIWETGSDGPWVSPANNSDVFDGLAAAERWEDGDCAVGGYIPTADLQALLDRLGDLAWVSGDDLLAETTDG